MRTRFMLAAAVLAAALCGASPAPAARGDCGQPITDGDSPTASDALAVLRAAVGAFECATCVCDVDGSGAVVASDALATLRRAVGQAVTLECAPCIVEVEITPAGGEITSADGLLTIVFPAGAVGAPTTVSIEAIALSELPEPASSAEDGEAYRLEPDGLALGVPAQVRATYESELVAGGALIALLLGADDDLEVLAGQETFVNADTEEHVGRASLQTLTRVAAFTADVSVTVLGVPDAAAVGEPHTLTVAVTDEDEVSTVTSATYTDDDFGVWQPADGNAIVAAPLAAAGDVFSGAFNYECSGVAQVVYRPSIDIVYDLVAGDFEVDDVAQRTTLEKTIDCGP